MSPKMGRRACSGRRASARDKSGNDGRKIYKRWCYVSFFDKDTNVPNPNLFIGPSKKNIEVARLVGNRLESDGCGDVSIWDEGVFSLNQGVLHRLLSVVGEFDFAIGG